MPKKKKTPYMKMVEEERTLIKAQKEELKRQLIIQKEEKIKKDGYTKLNEFKDVVKCSSVVIKPEATNSPTDKKAIRGVYCLGKGMGNN